MHITRCLALGLAAACSAAPTQIVDNAISLHELMLVDLQGHALSVDELRRGQRATVMTWFSGGCPCVRRYEQRIADLARRYRDQGVRVIAVASNADETLDDLRRLTNERRLMVPLYWDPNATVAEALGVHSTPTAVILDEHGNLRFRGWIDNEHDVGDSDREAYTEQALVTLLEGGTPRKASPVWGCPITRSLGKPAGACLDPTAVPQR